MAHEPGELAEMSEKSSRGRLRFRTEIGMCPGKAIRGLKTVARGWTILSPFQGAFGFQPRSGGIADAQPPANVCQPFRLAWNGCGYVQRHNP